MAILCLYKYHTNTLSLQHDLSYDSSIASPKRVLHKVRASSSALSFKYLFYLRSPSICGPGSSVVIAINYGLDGPGIESRGGEIFCTCPDRPWGPPSLLYNGYRVSPGGKERPGRDADPSPPSRAVVKKE